MIPAVHPFSAESGPHEIRGPVIIDVNWRNTPNITSCATLSDEGVCNNKQISKYHEKNVVLPSHMRVSATTTTINMVDFLSCPIVSYEGVCNLLLFRRWARTRSCPTLSYEGVCNQLKINISESWTFYLVCSNYLKYNPYMILSWKLRKYTEKYLNIMTIFHVSPHFNSPQPNLNLRKMNQVYSMKYTFSKNVQTSPLNIR